jgi:hypothetical protein
MISEKNRLIICNTQGESLGEMIFDHDLFLQANLLPSGDDILGGWLEDWQVKGILYFHPEIDSHNPICTTGEYVSMHDPVFPSALRQWLEKHNLYSILLPEPSWELWNTIQQLPLLPDEQFRLGMKLASINENDHSRFLKSLEKLTLEIERSPVTPKKTSKKSDAKPKKVKVSVKK